MQPVQRSADDDAFPDDAEGSGPPGHRRFGHGSGLIDRRGVLRGAAGLIPVTAGMAGLGWAVAPSEAEAASTSPPYPFAKRRVTRMDGHFLWKKGIGSDQWVSGELSTGTVLAGWGDGKGWHARGNRAFIGVTQIGGSATRPNATDVWRSSSLPLKPCAIVANNGPPLMFVVSDRDGRDGSYLMRGSSGGGSFSAPQGPILTKSRHGLVVVGSFDVPRNKISSSIGLYLYTGSDLREFIHSETGS